MAEERETDEGDAGVLAGLPATRPNRLGRQARIARTQSAGARKPAAKPSQKATPKAAKAAAAPARSEPGPTTIPANRKPRPIRAGHPGLDGAAGPERSERATQSDGPGLVGGVAHAAGGVVTGSVKLTGRLLKGVADRLPRP